MHAGGLPVRLPRAAPGGTADRIAARALLLLRVQSLLRQREGVGDVRSAVRAAQIGGDEVPDAEVADGAAAARERKQIPQADPKLVRYSSNALPRYRDESLSFLFLPFSLLSYFSSSFEPFEPREKRVVPPSRTTREIIREISGTLWRPTNRSAADRTIE